MAASDYPAYSLIAYYGHSVEMLIRHGQYDMVTNQDISTRNFPSIEGGKSQVDIYLFGFDHYISGSKFAIKKMREHGLRPATLKELLSLGIAYPDLQRRNNIMALGSNWVDNYGDLRVPYLGAIYPLTLPYMVVDESASDRYLGLFWFEGGVLGPNWRFAAVCNT